MSVISDVISRVLKVRSMVAADLPRLLQIEKQPAGARHLRQALPANQPSGDRGVWVATIQNGVVGYLIYQLFTEQGLPPSKNRIRKPRADKLIEVSSLEPPRVEVLHFFVDADWRRQGIGKALIERFEPKPYQQNDCCIQAAVPESHLPTQLLLRSAGYKAVRVLRGFFIDEDAYLMERNRM